MADEMTTFDDIKSTINFYIIRATDPRLSGWEHNHYRAWIHELRDVLNGAGELKLHGTDD